MHIWQGKGEPEAEVDLFEHGVQRAGDQGWRPGFGIVPENTGWDQIGLKARLRAQLRCIPWHLCCIQGIMRESEFFAPYNGDEYID